MHTSPTIAPAANIVTQFSQMFSSTFGDASNRLNERYQMTATIMVIAPLVLVYALLQNFFVKGIEASGITGE